MELSLPVTFRGEEVEYPLTVVPGRYGTRYIVEVEDVELVYERDDSGELRGALRDPSKADGKIPDRELVEAISRVLTQVIS